MRIIIKFFSDFCTSDFCKKIYETYLDEINTLSNYGIDKDIYITNDDDYTHVIILNTCCPVLKNNIPKENVIGFAFEPLPFLHLSNHFIDYAKKNISKYFIGDKMNLPDPFIEGPNFMWHTVPSLKSIPIKNKCMSIMCSQKKFAPGHNYRHQLVEAILRENIPIDIYGRGHIYYKNKDKRLKGEFKELEPYEEYDFHIAIENYGSNHYFTEKIMNPLLCNTTPIYLGCTTIEKYFENQMICLSGNIDKDIELLKNILSNPSNYKKNINIEKVRDTICLLKNVNQLFTHSAIYTLEV